MPSGPDGVWAPRQQPGSPRLPQHSERVRILIQLLRRASRSFSLKEPSYSRQLATTALSDRRSCSEFGAHMRASYGTGERGAMLSACLGAMFVSFGFDLEADLAALNLSSCSCFSTGDEVVCDPLEDSLVKRYQRVPVK
jgi:hypothetical protein